LGDGERREVRPQTEADATPTRWDQQLRKRGEPLAVIAKTAPLALLE
jgi:hypothetical protein